jgi:nucleoside-diphosphate-sugar epimerase
MASNLFVATLLSGIACVNAFRGVDTVFHAAALVGGTTLGDAVLPVVNVEGTRNVVDEAEASGSVSRFVHISTVGVMGCVACSRPVEENDTSTPRSPYGRTKLESEAAALASARSMSLVIARPMWVYMVKGRRAR